MHSSAVRAPLRPVGVQRHEPRGRLRQPSTAPERQRSVARSTRHPPQCPSSSSGAVSHSGGSLVAKGKNRCS